MRKRIFRNMCLLSLVTVIVSFALVFAVMYHEFDVRMQTELKMETEYLSAGIESGGEDYLSSIDADPDISRVTLIAADGEVLFDSEVDQNQMENHLSVLEKGRLPAFPGPSGNRLFIMHKSWMMVLSCGLQVPRTVFILPCCTAYPG